MADSHPPQSTNAPVAKSRNPVERLIVWGLIGVLLVAVAIEFKSRKSHQDVLEALLSKVKAVDEDSTKPEVTEAVVKEVVGNKAPSRAEDVTGGPLAAIGAKRVEVYSWFTLNPTSKREIWVLYGGKGKDAKELATVIEVRTSESIDEPAAVAVSPTAGEQGGPPPGMGGPPQGMGGPPGGMGGGRGMGGPPGGGQRGRPGAGPAADGAANADADKTDADKTDADKTDADKTDADKTDADKTDADKTDADKTDADKTDADKPSEEKPAAEKTGEDKTEKSETDKE